MIRINSIAWMRYYQQDIAQEAWKSGARDVDEYIHGTHIFVGTCPNCYIEITFCNSVDELAYNLRFGEHSEKISYY